MSENTKLQTIISEIEELTVLELAELVKALEDKFGVVAASAAVAVATPADSGQAEEEKTEFTVVLTAAGDQKINVIKAVRELNTDLGLKDAKDLVDNAPSNIMEDVDKDKANAAKQKLEDVGATVELK